MPSESKSLAIVKDAPPAVPVAFTALADEVAAQFNITGPSLWKAIKTECLPGGTASVAGKKENTLRAYSAVCSIPGITDG